MVRSMVGTNGQCSTFCHCPACGAWLPVTKKLLNSFAHQPLLTNLCSPTSLLELFQTASYSPEQHCTSQPLPTGKDVPTLVNTKQRSYIPHWKSSFWDLFLPCPFNGTSTIASWGTDQAGERPSLFFFSFWPGK